ncbi:unnamed protein product [Bursaphelenchus xylophilus]|uniref:UNC93-like protein MFSD11 n=1 Tax=Bursaphelenchus xylophilus TaxID=6326 RepID=A0A1I7SMM7_BURXY|nr:unnamed protein product [Bursaphelenchus xylophilus]CAG9130290.1 unnamed protein product [Bursaphelenchus xylophilus]
MLGISLAHLLPWTFRRRLLVMNSQTQNVVQLGIGFFLIFFAFNSASFVEEVVIDSFAEDGRITKHAGYNSLAIIYGSFTIFNFFAASVVHTLGVKTSMFLAGATYALFQAGFLYINDKFLYFSSALLGLGAAVIWTAQGKYLSMNSTEDTAERHAGIFWAISQACLSCGGVFMYIVFNSDSDKISDQTIMVLYGVFTSVTVLGMILIMLLRHSKGQTVHSPLMSEVPDPSPEPHLTLPQLFQSMFVLCRQKQMLMLILVFIYTGISLSFWGSIYPTCIGFTILLGENTKRLIALNAMAEGLGQASGGFIFGILGSKKFNISRTKVVCIATAINVVSFVAVYINFPNDASLGKTAAPGHISPNIYLALACGFLLGFGDATWNTQVFATLIGRYSKQSAQAFSIFKFFQSLMAAVAFFCGTTIPLDYHLILLTVTSIVACIAFSISERLSLSQEGMDNEATHVE